MIQVQNRQETRYLQLFLLMAPESLHLFFSAIHLISTLPVSVMQTGHRRMWQVWQTPTNIIKGPLNDSLLMNGFHSCHGYDMHCASLGFALLLTCRKEPNSYHNHLVQINKNDQKASHVPSIFGLDCCSKVITVVQEKVPLLLVISLSQEGFQSKKKRWKNKYKYNT